ncbi:MAG: 16S rRNA (cytidine(1402)-2'-O)-methyltransferase [Acidimicrobiia bacterium]|nr:16S rRNA (cytidine(1402)-2'-O)-methyltransferase [Acidimicrobiia bacterium]
MTGSVVLVATPIGNLGDISERCLEALRTADVLAAEDTRRTRALLSHFGIPASGRLTAMHAHNEAAVAARLVEKVADGAQVVYVTDAGMPGISDPGARLVSAAIDAGLDIEVVPGPNAALAALVQSGLPTDRFAFEGFVPRKGRDRADRLGAIAEEPRTVVIYEAPHRVGALVQDLAELLGAQRRIAIARELTKVHEEVWRGSLGEAVEHLAEREPRGEYVLVVEGAVSEEPGEDDVRAAVSVALARGASGRDAADEVARTLGVPRNLAYRIATELRDSR